MNGHFKRAPLGKIRAVQEMLRAGYSIAQVVAASGLAERTVVIIDSRTTYDE
jgi:hypothetical protein